MSSTVSDAADALLDAATSAFAQRGYHGTTMRQLASAMNLTKPSIYHRFPSKAALYTACVERQVLRYRAVITSDSALPLAKTLEAAADHYLGFARQFPDGLYLLVRVHPELLPDHLHNVHEDLAQHLAKIVERGRAMGEIRLDIDAHRAATTLLGTLFAHALAPKTRNAPAGAELVADFLLGASLQ